MENRKQRSEGRVYETAVERVARVEREFKRSLALGIIVKHGNNYEVKGDWLCFQLGIKTVNNRHLTPDEWLDFTDRVPERSGSTAGKRRKK